MIPRVFVSSTYYDLKHVRERLEKFIEGYGFEPVLFESDKIVYQPNKDIDRSAYYEIELCHVMILIIGGRYGTSATPDLSADQKQHYDNEFVSITRKEFETAHEKNIPALIFIEKSVYSDYETYLENQAFFDAASKEDLEKFRFAHVDDMQVFKFIDLVKSRPVKTFEKVEEIEEYLKSQFAGYFYLYLESLKGKSEEKKILDSVSELNSITLRMNEMLNSVGKQVLRNDEKEYQKVIDSQFEIILDYFDEKLKSTLYFKYHYDNDAIDRLPLDNVYDILIKHVVESAYPDLDNLGLEERVDIIEKFEYDIFVKINSELNELDESLELEILKIKEFRYLFKSKVLPHIRNIEEEEKLKARFKERIAILLLGLGRTRIPALIKDSHVKRPIRPSDWH